MSNGRRGCPSKAFEQVQERKHVIQESDTSNSEGDKITREEPNLVNICLLKSYKIHDGRIDECEVVISFHESKREIIFATTSIWELLNLV